MNEAFTQVAPELAAVLITFLITQVVLAVLAWRRWRLRHFDDRLTVSLNYVADGRFKIRTLLDTDLASVFPNPEMVRTLRRAARRQTEEDLLDIEPANYWFYLNAVLNAISQRFARGFVLEEAGAARTEREYLLFLTMERGTFVRQQKLRAMLVHESLLDSLDVESPPVFDNDFHAIRWASLVQVGRHWSETKGTTPRIRRIALVV